MQISKVYNAQSHAHKLSHMPPTTAPTTPNPIKIFTAQLALPLLTPMLSYPPSLFLAPTALSTLKHPNNSAPEPPIFSAKQLCTIAGLSVMQYWKHPSSSSVLTMGSEEDEENDGAEYVAMALMCPLQQASRMEEFEPPIGTAQEERLVGGAGIAVAGWQDIFAVGRKKSCS
jgi:hypothetical protein